MQKNTILHLIFLIFGSLVLSCNNKEAESSALTDKQQEELIAAISAKNYAAVSQCLQNGADVNMTDKNGVPIISLAASAGSIKIVKLLISHKADVNAEDDEHKSPLKYAIDNGKVKTAQLLLKHGADLTDMEHDALATEFDKAIESGSLKQIEAYLNVTDIHNPRQHNPLTFITKNNIASIKDAKIVKLIINHLKEKQQISAQEISDNFYAAIDTNHTEIAKVLVEAGGVLTIEHLGAAVGSGNEEIAKYIISQGVDIDSTETETNETLLHNAVLAEDTAEVTFLLKLGADVDKEAHHHTPLSLAIGSKNPEIIDILLQAGANPNAGTYIYDTAIAKAIRGGKPELVKKLMQAGGASPYKPSNSEYESDPFFCDLISACEKNELSKVQALIEAGIPLNARDFCGRLPLASAAKQGNLEIVKALTEAGADINSCGTTSVKYDITETVLSASLMHIDVLNYLISKGADVNRHNDKFQHTALHYACYHGYHQSVTSLLNAGANIDALTTLSETPLMLSAERGHVKTTQILLTRRANTTLTNKWGDTALSLARKNGHQPIIQLFNNASAN